MVTEWSKELLEHPGWSALFRFFISHCLMLDAAIEGGGKSAGNGPFKGLRVKMGIHTGEPICQEDPITG